MKRFFLITMLTAFAFLANAQNHWTYNPSDFSNDATYMAAVYLDGNYLASTDLELGAFCNGGTVCCDSQYPPQIITNEGGTFGLFFMRPRSNSNGETITFKVYDHSTNQEIDVNTTYTFAADGIQGSPMAPEQADITGNAYNITVVANPASAVSNITTGGLYATGANVNLSFTANAGYEFYNWTKNGVQFSTTETCTITVNETAEYSANFVAEVYTIYAFALPSAGGSATVNQTGFYYGEECTLTATPNTGYTFVNWTDDANTVVSTDATYSFPVVAGGNYYAHFNENPVPCEITASCNPTTAGTITGTGTFTTGETCTLTATANPGYDFLNWTKNGTVVCETEAYTFSVAETAEYVANFVTEIYTIYPFALPSAGGTVTINQTSFLYGEECTLTAMANTGYNFVNWTDDANVEVSTDATYTFNVTEGGNYYAHFEEIVGGPYTITTSCNPAEAGTVTGAGTFNAGETCTLTATANPGYYFLNWTKDGLEVGTVETYTFTVTEDAEYVANFTYEMCLINVTVNPAGAGTVTGDGAQAIGATCTLVATANTGYTFVNWTENDVVVSTEATYSFTVTVARDLVANFELSAGGPYTITATCNPTEAGTVTGAGTFNAGETCTLTATANPGYYFLNWTKDGLEVGTVETYTFTVTEDAEYVANFTYEMCLINVTVNPAGAGTVTGDGAQAIGATCTLVATANPGYTFLNWTENDEVVSTDATYSFTVTVARDLVANFELSAGGPYTITATCNPAEAGTVTGAGTFNAGETCTLTATPNEGYYFLNWTKDGVEVGTLETYTFTVTEDAEYVANFTYEMCLINVTVNPAGAGTVTGDGAQAIGATCTLVATANPGYTFLNWTENDEVVSTDATYSFTVTVARDLVANFQVSEQYTIWATCNPGLAGAVSGSNVYPAGATCTLTATANPGYYFLNWTKEGAIVSENESYSFTVTEEATYVANFTYDIFMIQVFADPSAGGVVTGAGGYVAGQTCTMTATANTGYEFIGWSTFDDPTILSTETSYSFQVYEAGAYVAHFGEGTHYLITATTNPEGAGTIEGAGYYAEGATCTLTATANTGYEFYSWTKDGVEVSTVESFSFTVTEDAEYVANFTYYSYIITAMADPTEGGTVTGGGTYLFGENCTLTATPNTGYAFLNWTRYDDPNTVISSDASYTFMVTSSETYVAHFTAETTYNITAECNPTLAGTVTGTGNYITGTTCTLTAVPAHSSFTFWNWTLNGEEVSTDESYTFTVTGDAHYVANFVYDLYIITPIAVPNYAGTVTGGGGFMYGETCELSATANDGYEFVNWTKDGLVVSTNATFSFTVTESGLYAANFENGLTYTITTVAMPAVGGTTTGDGTYEPGETVTLTATPNPGYHFINWTKDGEVVSTTANFTLTVTESATYVANFMTDLYYVTVLVNNANGGYVVGVYPGGYFLYGHDCILQAVPYDGYSFSHWTKDGQIVSYDPDYTFMVTADATVTAYFTQDGYHIGATADPAAGGSISGTGNYSFGQTCSLTATPNPGYTFVNWTLDGVEVSTNATYSFTVRESADYVAHFSQNMYTITVQANPSNAAYVFIQTGQNGQFHYGESCTLRVAAPNPGYTFLNWSLNGTIVSTEPTYTFNVTGDANFIANFAVDVFTVTTTAVPAIGGTVTGAGEYEYGETCTVTATPRAGYTFLRWVKNGVVVSTDANYTFTVREDAECVAQFTNRAIYIRATVALRSEGEITGDGVYEYGETVTMSVAPAENYIFVDWSVKGGEVVSSEATFSFIATEDLDLVANLVYFTDVNESSSINVSVFPNPVASELTVMSDQENYQLDIYTINGALVRSLNNCSNTTKINVEDLSNGTYIIRLTNGNVVENRRFVKE